MEYGEGIIAPAGVVGVIRDNINYVRSERDLGTKIPKAKNIANKCSALCVIENTDYVRYFRCSRRVEKDSFYCSAHGPLNNFVTSQYEDIYKGDEPPEAPAVPDEIYENEGLLITRRDLLEKAYLYRSTYTFLFRNKEVDISLSDNGHDFYTASLFDKVSLLNERIQEIKDSKPKAKSSKKKGGIQTLTVGDVTIGNVNAKSGIYGTSTSIKPPAKKPKKAPVKSPVNKDRKYVNRGGKGEAEDFYAALEEFKRLDLVDKKGKAEELIESELPIETVIKIDPTVRLEDIVFNRDVVLETVDELLDSQTFLQFTTSFIGYTEDLRILVDLFEQAVRDYNPSMDITAPLVPSRTNKDKVAIYEPFGNSLNAQMRASVIGDFVYQTYIFRFAELCEMFKNDMIKFFGTTIPNKIESVTNLKLSEKERKHFVKLIGYESIDFADDIANIVKYTKALLWDTGEWKKFGDILTNSIKKALPLFSLSEVVLRPDWNKTESLGAGLVIKLTSEVLKRPTFNRLTHLFLHSISVVSYLIGEYSFFHDINSDIITCLQWTITMVAEGVKKGKGEKESKLDEDMKKKLLTTLETSLLRTRFFTKNMHANIYINGKKLADAHMYFQKLGEIPEGLFSKIERKYAIRVAEDIKENILMVTDGIKGGETELKRGTFYIDHYTVISRCFQGMLNVYKNGYIAGKSWARPFVQAYGRNAFDAFGELDELFRRQNVSLIEQKVVSSQE